MPQWLSSADAPSRPRRRDVGPVVARGRRRGPHALAALALAAVLLVWPPPVLAPGVACGPVGPETAVVTVGALADDGELTEITERVIAADGTTCVDTATSDALSIAVGVVHTDVEGRSREAGELQRIEDPVTTRVAARDVTAVSREVTALGPLGAATVERTLGVPQLVRVAVRYPASWDVTAPEGDGVSTSVLDGVVEVARTALLFPPLLDDTVVLEVQATPGRGTPTILAEATPMAGVEPFVLPAGVLEQDAAAVVGALATLAEDGAVELADGAGAVAEGAEELTDGATELADGAEDLAGGLFGLAAGADELASGAGEVAGGASGLADGTRQLADGVEDSAAGSGELAAGAGQLGAGTTELAAAAGELARGIGELAEGAGALADGLAGEQGSDAPDGDLDELVNGLADIATGIGAVRDGLTAALPPDAAPDDPLVVAVAELSGLVGATETLAGELGAALGDIEAALAGVSAAAAAAGELATGAEEASAGAVALASGIDELATAANELAAGTRALTGGLDQLAGASGELTAGAQGVATGTAGLAEGSRELAAGSDELADGGAGLAEGSGELASGTAELAEGTSELAVGAEELPGVLAEVVGVADRSGQDAATTLAILDAGSVLAQEQVGDAALRTQQLRHIGEDPVPMAAWAGSAASVLVVLLGLVGLLRRRGRG